MIKCNIPHANISRSQNNVLQHNAACSVFAVIVNDSPKWMYVLDTRYNQTLQVYGLYLGARLFTILIMVQNKMPDVTGNH